MKIKEQDLKLISKLCHSTVTAGPVTYYLFASYYIKHKEGKKPKQVYYIVDTPQKIRQIYLTGFVNTVFSIEDYLLFQEGESQLEGIPGPAPSQTIKN